MGATAEPTRQRAEPPNSGALRQTVSCLVPVSVAGICEKFYYLGSIVVLLIS
jgi:hypothetical protein